MLVVIRRKKAAAGKKRPDFKEGQKVESEIFPQTKMAFVAVINGSHTLQKRLITLEDDGIRLKEKQKPPPQKSTARYGKPASKSR